MAFGLAFGHNTAFGHNKFIELITAFDKSKLIKLIIAFGLNKLIGFISHVGHTNSLVSLISCIGLNSLTAIGGPDRQLFFELRARVVSPRIFVRLQSLIAR
jgi:hypothetical protein